VKIISKAFDGAWTISIYYVRVYLQVLEDWFAVTKWQKKSDDTITHFDRIYQRDGRTDEHRMKV